MKSKKIIALLTFCCLLSTFGMAQITKKWSLEDCIKSAITNNLTVQRSLLNQELANSRYNGQKGTFLPTVNGFAGTTINFGRTIDPFTNTFATDQVRSDSYGVRANWDLFNGMQRYNSYKQNQMEVEASRYDAEKTKNDISLAVTRSFLEIVFNKELLKVAEEQQVLTEQQVKRTKNLVDAGSLPQGNLMDMQAQLAQDELNTVTVGNNLKLSYLQLLILMRMDTLESFEIDIPEIKTENLSGLKTTPSFVYLKAVESLPEVQSAKLRLESAQNGISMSKGRLSPTLGFNASLGSGFSGKNIDVATGETKPFGKQVSDNFNQSIGFSLSIPIFNSLSTRTNIQQAKISKELRQNEMDQVKYEINETVKRAYFDAQAARKAYLANEKAVNARMQSYTYSERRYKVGVMNAIEFNQAKNSLVKSEADLLRAKFDYVFKTMILDFYQGIPLSLRP